MRLLRFLRLPALLGLLRPLISFVSFSYSLTSSAALLDGGLWGGYEKIFKIPLKKIKQNGTKDGVNYEYDYSVAASIASESFTYQGTEYILRFVAVAVTQTAEAV